MHNSYFNVFTSLAGATLIVKTVLILLLLLSIYSWGVILNKFRVLRQATALVIKLRNIAKYSNYNLPSLLQQFYQFKHNPYTNIVQVLVDNQKILMEQPHLEPIVLDKLWAELYDINFELEKRVSVLATIGALAPFIGLFGTVVGIINSFSSIGVHSSAALAAIAPGIAEALYSTAIGLFVAVPAVFAYNILTNKVAQYKDLQVILMQDILLIFKQYNLSLTTNSNTQDRGLNQVNL